MYALRVARLCPPVQRHGWLLAAANWYGPGATFAGPLWRAECRCPVAIPHDPPAADGKCGLYALARGTLVVKDGWFEFRAASPRPPLCQSFGLEALVIVEALGRTCHGETGVVRSAAQVPQYIVPHQTGCGMGDKVLEAIGARRGVAEDLTARYECHVVGWDEFRARLERLVPDVAVRYVTERRSHDGS